MFSHFIALKIQRIRNGETVPANSETLYQIRKADPALANMLRMIPKDPAFDSHSHFTYQVFIGHCFPLIEDRK
jgi:hypothetical protein